MSLLTKQDPEAIERRERFCWVEAGVWTDRMLAALENGVKGGNAFFAERGLFTCLQAYTLASQSRCGNT